MAKGVLLIVSGPSGCGKGTVLKYLLENKEYSYSVSATTRNPREGEIHGVSYFFISREEFETWLAEGKILEHTLYCDNYYGTPRAFVESQLEKGVNVVLEIETEGAANIKALMPHALSVFIAPPSMEDLEKRLVGRGTEDSAVIEKRLNKAREEMKLASTYDVVIVNEDGAPEKAAAQIHKAVTEKKTV
ncbi:MAG: guanylate kinase [Ruminococcaceae bacterium]|nr:guanylate kinase [Oscillospiraceae bacterium]